jgi:hypothetical protein
MWIWIWTYLPGHWTPKYGHISRHRTITFYVDKGQSGCDNY